MTWLLSRQELTPEQMRAIELDSGEHRLIAGPPGSGKTQILLYRARYLLDLFKPPPERFHIFVFTNVLKNYISSALELLNLPQDCISTLDHWCSTFYKEQIGKRAPWDKANKTPDFVGIRRAVLEKVKKLRHKLPLLDFVMVDEGQDLDSEAFELLRLIAGHVTVCMDHKQRIYEKGSSEIEVLRSLGINKRNMTLLGAYRCSPYVARLAAEFIAAPDDRELFLHQAKTYAVEKETPLLYLANDQAGETARLMEMLKIRRSKSESIAVLFHKKRQVYGFANGMREAGIEVETMDDMDFTSDLPKIITYKSAKGLTFDTVFLPRLVSNSFSKVKDDMVNQLLFVGITRAIKWVYLSSIEGKELSRVKQLYDKGARALLDLLTIQRSEDAPVAATSTDEQSHDKQIDLLDLL